MSDLRVEAAFLYDEAQARRESGNPSGALMRYLRCLEIAEQLGDATWRAHLELEVAQMHHALYELAEARRRYEQARAHFAEVGDAAGEATALVGWARVDHLDGHYSHALSLLPEALDHANRAGDPVAAGLALTTMGQCLWDSGNSGEGLAKMVEGVRRLAASGAPEADAAAEQLRYYGGRLGADEFRAAVEAATDDERVRRLVLEG